jgi:DeoR family transcriptional regulator, suf operon transcriptional repressor
VLTPPTVSDSRRSVIEALKHAGEASAEQLATTLDMTVAGARQHLTALVDEGLVAGVEERRPAGERGRPRLVYSLTRRAEPLFPKAYDELANDLLAHAAAEDGTLIDRIFVRRRDARVDHAVPRVARKRTLRGQVAELTRILDEDGYLADWEALPDGSFRIVEHNCAILAVARRHPQACRTEIEFLQTVLPQADVSRVSHIVAGAHQCAYLVTPRPGDRAEQ